MPPSAERNSEYHLPSVPSGRLVVETTSRSATVNFAALELTPSADNTVTEAGPGEAIIPAGTDAVNCDALTYAVASGEPFHCRTMLPPKLAPFTVSVNAGPATTRNAGLRLVIDGAATTVNGTAGETAPEAEPPPAPAAAK
jgi:hypothetical protein